MLQAIQTFFVPPKIEKSPYFPQIDGLRALAVLAVFLNHFLNVPPLTKIHWGHIGVVHFFVISGLLITLILLTQRDKSNDEAVSRTTILKNFYIRRFIRIFPIYYLTIAVLYIAGYPAVVNNLGWLVTYTVNISQGFFAGSFGNTTHFWSLSVEEQFYIFFPLFILFFRRRHIPYLLIMLIISSIIYKYVGIINGLDWKATSRFLLGNLDALGLGALYTYYLVYYEQYKRTFTILLGSCFVVGIPLLVVTQMQALSTSLGAVQSDNQYVAIINLAISMTSIVLLHFAVKNSRWLPGYLLRLAPMRYIGKISYGAYLYHFLLRDIDLYSKTPVEGFLMLSLLSLGLASLSWHLIEEPINQFKQYFPYLGKKDSTPNT